ncbi:pseudouridine synthase [Companilactobacillus pabuli]|jgi:pseudouridine synthase|uniref:Pseudouridine synthase n=1 Tax=Companilactobacillus pabuli TaxID=2714036 RepID=A0A7L7KVV2_9LACO|nr:pseudouridine synthase [Companilactobacillus pabuli]AKP03985.1 pseudouridine synthase [Companilactobacillus farciminis]AKS52290.1 pseudouridine synthase [Companilactobacillus farciminis]MDG5113238.1 pseudouridine synthase [Companilactobacillus pabuli]QMT83951.1 rRNA pseudouridine synthase [Companilactobacillus pabuli]GAQ00336.1 ribosomal large subunit pseudouridine synthase B [Companilactobacillus farciminis]
MEKVRLQKYMADAGVASRRKSEELIAKGHVKVNGKLITEMGVKVDNHDRIEVDGVPMEEEKKRYILMYKPRGVISAVSDDKDRKVVTDLLEDDVRERVYPIGRLDYDTSGLLLLTNDGDFANHLMHPRYHVDKTYIAKVEGILTTEEIRKLENGIKLKGYTTAKAKVRVMSKDKKKNSSIVRMVIHEGHNHQVKNMFDAVGHKVEKLSRESYDFLTLDGLVSGQYRDLTRLEVATLKKKQH